MKTLRIGGNAFAWGVTGLLAPWLAAPIGDAFGLVLGWVLARGIVAAIAAAPFLFPLARLTPAQ